MPDETGKAGRPAALLIAALVAALLAAMAASLLLGVADLGSESWAETWELLWNSRVPRTPATVFAGAGMAVSGLILQMLLRNRYV